MMHLLRTRLRLTLLLLLCAAVCGCGTPGSSGGAVTARSGPVSTGFDTGEKVSLTMWDDETSPGDSKAQDQLIHEFEQRYPNVTVHRVVKSFDDYMSTIKLAASSSNAPDVFQGNEGYAVDQALIKAGLILPLDGQAAAYGWDTRFGNPLTLDPLRWSADGATWGSGTLWGVAQKAEVLGVFYDKDVMARLGLRPPRTFAQFQQTLAKAKAAGVPPVMVGGLDRWPLGHVFMVLQALFEKPSAVSAWAFGHPGASFDTPGTRKAAEVFAQWGAKGYFENGFNGVSQQTAAARFAKGEGLYFITGPWENQTFAGPLGNRVGFFPMPGTGSAPSAATGSLSLPYHISSRTPHPEVAAALIDYLTGQHAAKLLIENGDLPAADPGSAALDGGSSLAAIARTWRQKSRAGLLVPYLDWATASMGDTLFGGLQQLSQGATTPAQFTAAVQKDWESAHS
jgi:raffinose/stachyose/melibiose transport system substrate-binding protein